MEEKKSSKMAVKIDENFKTHCSVATRSISITFSECNGPSYPIYNIPSLSYVLSSSTHRLHDGFYLIYLYIFVVCLKMH